ncbi:hypothetical protein AAFF_G00411370 [Aldrovandia affinis]|uniref:Integrase p58-like C-terminal domain-containing protein n=1 Tax=Aldrovandia affinis TaxID=143900 RepID=A0AAD7SBA1_9TELE|nr:hypothetical protein AAFF_G00411370 [Aldrovandia affinis]
MILLASFGNFGARPLRSRSGTWRPPGGPAGWKRCRGKILNCSTTRGDSTATQQEAQAQLVPTVATLRANDGEAGCLPFSSAQVQEAQERDAALTHVQSWLAAGKRPEWVDMAALDTETRAYHSQWGGLEAQAESGVKHERAYDTRCRGQAFAPGGRVGIFCPSRTKGVSPKLRSRWRGLGEVLQWLGDVVYRVRMPGRGREVVLHQDRLAPYRPLVHPATFKRLCAGQWGRQGWLTPCKGAM